MQALYAQAQQRSKGAALPRILFPESDDERVRDAATMLIDENLATPVFESIDTAPAGSEILNNRSDAQVVGQQIDELIQSALIKKGPDSVTQAQADRLYRGAAILKLGLADAAVSGSIASTGDVLRAGFRIVGLAPSTNVVSSFFLMEFDEQVSAFADCAVIPLPEAAELADIAISTARNFQRLTGKEPRVAMLSFSTSGSADHPRSLLVREATEIAQQAAPDLLIDGELQFDAAIEASVGQRKAPNSKVAGQANVFVFPSLEAGNIGYKIAERVGGAHAIGPILQGMSLPWMDLSRGCKARNIVDVAVIASLMAAKVKR